MVEYTVDDTLDNANINLCLEDTNEKFDQFEINKEKFNVSSTYDELNYTTPLDYNSLTEEMKQKAMRIESELTNSSNKDLNRHIKEDRGLLKESEANEEDEEMVYSTVYRN